MRVKLIAAIVAVLAFTQLAQPAQASTLDTVKEAGVLRCGVQELGPALSYISDNGSWAGFYPNICHAIAAAVLGDAEAVEFVITGSDDRFDNLREDAFDVLVESTTWTLGRDVDGLEFLPMYLFDGQGFLVFKPSGKTKLSDLNGSKICVEGHTTSEGNLHDYAKANHTNWDIRPYGTMEGTFRAFFDHQCDAVSTDVFVIASFRAALAPNPADYVFLPERISKEPLSPVVRSDDAKWADVVRWVVNALIAAEELGITSDNLVDMSNSTNPETRRLLGLEGDIGKQLGLDARWAERAIRTAGNYGELYKKTLDAELNIERGINDQWTKGGLIWSPPIR